jgi:hypothetical protein
MEINLTLSEVIAKVSRSNKSLILGKKTYKRVNNNLRIISSLETIPNNRWLLGWLLWDLNSTFLRVENSEISELLNNLIFIINEVFNSTVKFGKERLDLVLISLISSFFLHFLHILILLVNEFVHIGNRCNNGSFLFISNSSALRENRRDH